MALIKKRNTDLIVEGNNITSIETLREFPSTDLLKLCYNGDLTSWLRKQSMNKEVGDLERYIFTKDPVKDLAFIFKVLSIDVDIKDISDIINSSDTEKEKLNSVYNSKRLTYGFDLENFKISEWKKVSQYCKSMICTESGFFLLEGNCIYYSKDLQKFDIVSRVSHIEDSENFKGDALYYVDGLIILQTKKNNNSYFGCSEKKMYSSSDGITWSKYSEEFGGGYIYLDKEYITMVNGIIFSVKDKYIYASKDFVKWKMICDDLPEDYRSDKFITLFSTWNSGLLYSNNIIAVKCDSKTIYREIY